MRLPRNAALGATTLALLISACSSGGGSSSAPASVGAASEPPSASAPASTEASAPAQAGPSIASQLVLGGPPECPERPACQLGLQETYGLVFKEFKPLDAGGPLTVEALKSGDIQVGLLFTSDPAIAAEGFVLLEDDKALQLADNIVPVVRQEVLDTNPGVADLLNAIMAKLTQEELIALNQAVLIDGKTSAEAASAWIAAQGFATGGGLSGDVTVGSANFAESEILGEIFSQVLEANGLTVERKFQIGNREVYFPAIESGEIDIFPEYAASALAVGAGLPDQATTDPETTTAALKAALEPKGITALDYAPATDQNGFVVPGAIAQQYALQKISDLANPAPAP